eukprot:11113238-Alexandrium_andersonii.AAC.1
MALSRTSNGLTPVRSSARQRASQPRTIRRGRSRSSHLPPTLPPFPTACCGNMGRPGNSFFLGSGQSPGPPHPVSYTHLRAHETSAHL